MPTLKQRLSYLILGQKGGRNRIQIIEELNERPYNLNQLAEKLNLNYRTVKHHMEVLMENEIVSSSRTGRYGEVYFLSPEMDKNMDVFNAVIKKLNDVTTSPKFFQNVIEQTQYAVIIVNLDLEVFFWNESAESMFGYLDRDIRGEKIPIFPDEKIRDEIIGRALEEGSVSGIEAGMISGSGDPIEVNLSIDAITEEAGERIGYSIVINDITMRKKTERELDRHREHLEELVDQRTKELTKTNKELEEEIRERMEAEGKLIESQRKMSLLLDNLPGMAYRCLNDRDWTMEFISEGCLDLTGYSPADFVDNAKVSYNEIIHPDDRGMVWDEVQTSIDKRKPFRITYRITSREGMEKWVWEQGQGVFSEDGSLLALEGFITDTTDRVKAEKALRDSEVMMQSIFKAAPIGIGVVVDRNFIYVNDLMCRMVGFDRKELVGRSARILYPSEEEYKRVGDVKYKQIRETGMGTVETVFRRKDGSEIDILLSSAPIDPTDLKNGVTFTALDITERKKAMRELGDCVKTKD
ncbi:MAG: PAS domain S-box protein [Thermoplasmatota archaeon]